MLSINERVSVGNFTSMTNVNLNEDIEEVTDSWFINGIITNDDDPPGLERLEVGS